MTADELLGFFWRILTMALGHAVILVAAYKSARRFIDMAAKGERVFSLENQARQAMQDQRPATFGGGILGGFSQVGNRDAGVAKLMRDLENDRGGQ